jgi:membrane protein DedA with SNARE-associated domain
VGYIAYQGHAEYLILIPLTISAILLSDACMYFIAKSFGLKILTVWPFKKVITPARIDKARESFNIHGYRIVFSARFMPGIRTVFMFTSGLLGLRFWKFMLHDLAGAIIVVPLTIYSIKWVAGNKDLILEQLHKFQFVALGLGVAYVAYRCMRKKREKTISS